MHRFLAALCAALLVLLAAVAPAFAQERPAEPFSPTLDLMSALQSDPATVRSAVFVLFEDETPVSPVSPRAASTEPRNAQHVIRDKPHAARGAGWGLSRAHSCAGVGLCYNCPP